MNRLILVSLLATSLTTTTACARTWSNVPDSVLDQVQSTPFERDHLRGADTVVERHVVIQASPACVYDVLANVPAWGAWDTSISESYFVDGDSFDVGTVFHQGFADRDFEAHAEVVLANPGELIVWRGQSPDGHGPVGVHSFRLADNGDGTTTVVNREAFSAWYFRPVGWLTNLGIAAQFEHVNEALSRRASEGCGVAFEVASSQQ